MPRYLMRPKGSRNWVDQIVRDFRCEVGTLAARDLASRSWHERPATGLRNAVGRGELDSGVARHLIDTLRHPSGEAAGKPDVPVAVERTSGIRILW